jgi:hypothetical protein
MPNEDVIAQAANVAAFVTEENSRAEFIVIPLLKTLN